MKSISASLVTLLGLAAVGQARPTAQPRNVIAGIDAISTPIVRDAITYVRGLSDDMTYNHVVRSYLFGAYIITHDAAYNTTVDQEVNALAALMHDIGWDVKNKAKGVISDDLRFEVDSAIAARNFIRNHADGKNWDERRVQLVWDSIALHAEHQIQAHKELDVRVVGYGIEADFTGERIPAALYKSVNAEYANMNLMDGAKSKMIELCQTKPKSTYDNWQQAYGEIFVPNYSAKGFRMADMGMGDSEYLGSMGPMPGMDHGKGSAPKDMGGMNHDMGASPKGAGGMSHDMGAAPKGMGGMNHDMGGAQGMGGMNHDMGGKQGMGGMNHNM